MKNLNPRILILGGSGLLGSTLGPELKKKGRDVLLHGKSREADFQFDVTDRRQCETFLTEINPDVVINLVAMTNVDMCELKLQDAFLLNVNAVENLVDWVSTKDRHLIHISTDHVYDGPGEKDEKQPTISNMYAMTKYAGELAALKNKNSTILRTNFFGKSRCSGKKSFSDWIVEEARTGKDVPFFEDVYFSPLSMHTLSEAVHEVIQEPHSGVFNLGSRNGLSKADFAFLLAKNLDLPTEKFRRVSIQSANLRAKRPCNMLMDSSLFARTFSFPLPTLNEEIQKAAELYVI